MNGKCPRCKKYMYYAGEFDFGRDRWIKYTCPECHSIDWDIKFDYNRKDN